MTIVPIAAILLMMNTGFERIWVDADGYEVHSGFFGQSSESVKFDSISAIRIAKERTTGRRPRTIDVYYFDLRAGGSERFPLINDVKIEAAREILRRAQARGIALPAIPAQEP
jgi:hypothetical protein